MEIDLIPLDQLTDAEVDFLIQKRAEDEAWEIHPGDPIHRENDIKKRKVRMRAELVQVADDVKQGKSDMPGIHPAQCGRDPQVRLRSPKGFESPPIPEFIMDVENDQPYMRQQLDRLGFLDHPGIRMLALNPETSTIIPVFKLDRWFLISPEAEALRPVLRLASRLIMSPPSIRYLHALMYNERFPEETANRIWARDYLFEIQYNQSQDRATSELTTLLLHGLTELSKTVTWSLFDSQTKLLDGSTAKNMINGDGFTQHNHETKNTSIYINAYHVRFLEWITFRSDRTPKTVCTAVRLRLYIANLLCHELCHAFNKWIHGGAWSYIAEPFFGNYPLTECGYTWEQEVFGGMMSYAWDRDGIENAVWSPLRIEKWPRAWDLGDYFYNQDDRSVRYIRRYPRGSSTSYYLWMQWIESLFREENWAHVMAADKLDCLRPPKSFGFRSWGDAKYVDKDWRRSQSSEAVAEDHRGRVVRNPEWRSQLTPTPPGDDLW